MKEEIQEMEKCVTYLALELPEPVHKDIRRIWNNLKAKLTIAEPEGINASKKDAENLKILEKF